MTCTIPAKYAYGEKGICIEVGREVLLLFCCITALKQNHSSTVLMLHGDILSLSFLTSIRLQGEGCIVQPNETLNYVIKLVNVGAGYS